MRNKYMLFTALVLGFMISCTNTEKEFDAFGHFETREINVFSENPGRLIMFSVESGMELKKGELVGLVDTTAVYNKIQEASAGKKAALAKIPGVKDQQNILEKEIEILDSEILRLSGLVGKGAVTQKQLDDLVNKRELALVKNNSFRSQISSINAEAKVIETMILSLDDQLKKSFIYSPIDGVVLGRYVSESELVGPGKLLFGMASLDKMELKAFVSGGQLSKIEIGQLVKVRIDWEDGYKDYKGKITWIASEAEFTPKIIQTKEERVNLVYAIKVLVENDGKIKIGMPGEIVFE